MTANTNPPSTNPRQYLPVNPPAMRAWRAVCALALLSLAISAPSLGNWCGWSTDCFSFLTHARTLAETGSFVESRVNTPPGYPVLLATLVRISGELPILGLRWLSALALAASAVGTYLIHRERIGARWAWVAGLVVASSPVLLRLTTNPLSEPLFMAILCALIILSQRWMARGIQSPLEVILGGLGLAALILIRSMGIALLPCMIWAILKCPHRSRWSRAGCAASLSFVTMTPIIAWELRQQQYPVTFGYQQAWTHARDAESTTATGLPLQAERLARFGLLRLESIKELFLPKTILWRAYQPPLNQPTTWLIGGGVVFIGLTLAMHRQSPTDLYALLTLLMLALWPYDEGVRLVSPLLPIFIAYPFVAAQWIMRQLKQNPAARWTITTILLGWISLHAWGTGDWWSRLPAYRAKQVALLDQIEEMSAWQRDHLPKQECVAILPEGDNSKLVLAGAAYLARTTIRYVDCIPGRPLDIGTAPITTALVHHSLSDSVRQITSLTPTGKIGPFTILQRPMSTDIAHAKTE